MRNQKKLALKTGTDDRNNQYFYYCPKCGGVNALNLKRCTSCNAKRPVDAYEQAVQSLAAQSRRSEALGPVDRTARNMMPTAPNPCFAVPLPPDNNYDKENYTTNNLLGIPTYYSTDEYGRVFKTKVTYGAMPHSAPVPIPTPSKVVQTTTINVPLNNGQNN